ncbi:MAG TPA: TonB family protein, partial [Burkholderiaceae bacterium]|nr:TonB family protein [Burkholderiaceae bacterium]
RAAASPEASAQARRQAERGTADRGASDRGSPVTPAAVLAAAQAALNTASPTDSGVAAAAAVQALTARPAVAAAQPPSAPPSSAGESPSAAPEPAAGATAPQATTEQAPPATVMTVGANPAALSNAGKAAPLGEQVASLAPPPRPQSAPVQLHQRKHDPPEFPIRAVRSKVFEGHVVARIWITPEGNVDQVDIVKATPPRLFDEEVKRALGAWTFDPPGRPVDTTVQLDFKP